LKLLKGVPGKRRVPQPLMPAMPEQPPEPPTWLSPGAQAEWRTIAPHLHSLGLLTELDLMPFAAYVTALARWQQAERLLADTPGTLADADRARLVRIANRERADMVRFGGQFGLGSHSRARLTSPAPSGGKFSGLLA
jgi:P27 family predicted phage terminase small subunit